MEWLVRRCLDDAWRASHAGVRRNVDQLDRLSRTRCGDRSRIPGWGVRWRGRSVLFGPQRTGHRLHIAELGRREPHVDRRTNRDRKSTRLNSSHGYISYAVFCFKKKDESLRPRPLSSSTLTSPGLFLYATWHY